MLAGIFDPQICRSSLFQERERLLRGFPDLAPNDLQVLVHPGFVVADTIGSLAWSASGNAIAWNGRLDNCAELVHKYSSIPGNDAEIALSAFERNGESGLCDLIGDWAAVIFDAPTSVILASDYAGVRPIYYHYANARLSWSSSLAFLVAYLQDTGDLDEDYAAEFVVRGGSPNRTPYSKIRVVPPGYALRVCNGAVISNTFWKLSPERLYFHDEREYETRFNDLFREAVAVRLRTTGPVYAELSGGLDSSAIVSMSQRLIGERAVPAPRLSSVYYSSPDSLDERFHGAVEHALGLQSQHLSTKDYSCLTADSAGGVTPAWWETRYLELARHMTAAGSHVFLTGRLGDLVMGNYLDDSEQVGDLIRHLSILKAWKEAMVWSQILRQPVYWIVARAIRLNLTFCSRSVDHAPEDSLRGPFQERVRGSCRSYSKLREWNRESPTRRKRFMMLHDVIESRALQAPEPLEHVSYTHPYSHRPLVEYMLAIPAAVVCGAGQPRRLMRAALRHLLPPPVLKRRSKASFNRVFIEALHPIVVDMLRAPRKILLVARGWVEPRSFEARLRNFLSGLDCNEPQLRQLILLELWLRNFESGR